nr:hypothetical protein CFP56_07495 [Quercus suber]
MQVADWQRRIDAWGQCWRVALSGTGESSPQLQHSCHSPAEGDCSFVPPETSRGEGPNTREDTRQVDADGAYLNLHASRPYPTVQPLLSLHTMPTYRAADISASLQVTDLQQSLPADIHARHTELQRREMKRIEALFLTATALPERPMREDGSSRASFLRFVGQRGVLTPLLVCEAGQHILTAPENPLPALRRHHKIPDIIVSSDSQNVQIRRHSEPQLLENDAVAITTSQSTPLGGKQCTAPIGPRSLLNDNDKCTISDGSSTIEELAIAPQDVKRSQHIHGKSKNTLSPAKSSSKRHAVMTKSKSCEVKPAKADAQWALDVARPEEKLPQALCIAVELTDKSYPAGKMGGFTKHDGCDFQVEVFINGALVGSCYVNKRVSGVSAVEMVRGRLIFRGRRVHKQVEAVWVYLPRDAEARDESETNHSTDNDEHWVAVSDSLASEADRRGWDTKLGLAPPSADYLRGLSELPKPNDLPRRSGLGLVDVIVTAGNGKKASQALGHIEQPTRMRSAQYSADNKQIIPVSKKSSVVMMDTPMRTSDEPAESKTTFLGTISLPTPVKLHSAAAAVNTSTNNLASILPERDPSATRLNNGDVNDMCLIDMKTAPADVSRISTLDLPQNTASSEMLDSPRRKRQKLSAARDQPPASGEKAKYWDLIAEFDFSRLDPSKINLARPLTLGTTRGSKTLTRPLSRCLTSLKQMSSSNRKRQVKNIEQTLGGNLLDMMNEASREDLNTTTSGQLDAEAQERDELPAKQPSLKSNATSIVPQKEASFICTERDKITVNQLLPLPNISSGHAVPGASTPLQGLGTSTTPLSDIKIPIIPDLANLSLNARASGSNNAGLTQARTSLVLDRGAPSNGYLVRKVLPPSLQDSTVDIASPQLDVPDDSRSSMDTPEGDRISSLRQSPDTLVSDITITSLGQSCSAATIASSESQSRSELVYEQPQTEPAHCPSSRTSKSRHDTSIIEASSSPRLTVEQQFQAINAGVHPATSSISTRPSRNVRARFTPPRTEPKESPTKVREPEKVPIDTSPHPSSRGRADGTKVPEFIEAMNNFEVPELSEGSSVGYSEAPTRFRHTGKARRGEFKEQEVVVGFRFCVF